MTVWLDGMLIPASVARIDPTDRGFTLGDGLFETVRIANARTIWLDRHLARLRRGASLLGIAVPFDDPALLAAFADLLAANQVEVGSARLTLSRGPSPRGLLPASHTRPTVLITAASGVAPDAPVSAVLCRATRRNQASPLSGIKSLSYLDGVMARIEAAGRDADDAVLLNTEGQVAEASAANLFVLADGVLSTPSVADGALPGILRGLVLERCGAIERSIAPETLTGADAVFLTNALGIRCIALLDGVPLGRRDDVLAALREKVMP